MRPECETIQTKLEAYLAHELGPEENGAVTAHLQQCPACRAAEQDVRRLIGILKEAGRDAAGEIGVSGGFEAELRRRLAAAEQNVPGVTRPAAGGPHRRRKIRRGLTAAVRYAGIAAAVLLMLAVGGYFILMGTKPAAPDAVTAVIHAAEGEVFLRGARAVRPAGPGMPVTAGDAVLTCPEGTARIRYPDEPTEIGLHGAAVLVLDVQDGARRLTLECGMIDCSVAPQPPGRPLAITTPQARIEVRGTEFTLAATAEATRLEVTAGLVRLTRISDGAAADVAAGQFIIAAPGTPAAVMPVRPEETAGTAEDGGMDLQPPVALNASGWRHADLNGTYGQGFTFEGDRLVKAVTGKPVRIERAVPLREGEILFAYEMDGPYFEFRVFDQPFTGNDLAIGFDRRLAGRHACRVSITGRTVQVFIDGRPEKARLAIAPLDRAIEGRTVLRFETAADTALVVTDMQYRCRSGSAGYTNLPTGIKP